MRPSTWPSASPRSTACWPGFADTLRGVPVPDADAAPTPRDDIEAAIRDLVAAGEVDAATTRALEHYGPELYGFLRALARDDDLAAEAFAAASEQLWRN